MKVRDRGGIEFKGEVVRWRDIGGETEKGGEIEKQKERKETNKQSKG